MTRILTLILLCITLAIPASANSPRPLAQAMDALRDGSWNNAERLAERDGAIASDIIEWHKLRAGLGSFSEITAFLKRRPDWPGLDWLRRKSEPIVAQQNDAAILAFYSGEPPQTAGGILAYAKALAAKGDKTNAKAIIVLAWRTMRMSAQEQALYLGSYESVLGEHHITRLDRMLWMGWRDDALRMTALVPKDWQALARARLALRAREDGVNALIDQVPAALQSHPGLAYERFEWRAGKRLDTALDLLIERSTSADALGLPEVWAPRRQTLARDKMRAGQAQLAYGIAANNFLSEGSEYADLEWLAGYIALRKLNNPEKAVYHFLRFDGAVESPISKGRAGYWLGRAYQALGNDAQAQVAFDAGARFQTSFYGLLAAEAAGQHFDVNLSKPAADAPWREAGFTQSSVYEAGILLLASGELDLAERFFTHLSESLSQAEATQLGDMAIEMERPHLAVMIGKRKATQGVVIAGPYYALHPVHRMKLPMAPEMVLAIARRESEFDPVVISGVGARGLMQIMPATAQQVARALGRGDAHSTARLLSDWRYNAELGAAYLATLAGRFDGNVVMMSAGYNAGPGRPAQWMEKFGDPRNRTSPNFDMIDWIEHIPFDETRNYVMRVTESLPIYRALLGGNPLPIPFSKELSGSTLRAFAPKGE